MSAFSDSNRSPLLKKLAGAITGIAASGTMVVKFPPGQTYLEIALQCTIAGTAATRAQLESMLLSCRLTVSGVEKWTLTAKQLIAIAEYYNVGVVGATGFLMIPFERLWMVGIDAQVGPAYGTLGESSMQLEITQDATSTIDAVTAWARISPVAEPLGAHMRAARLTPSFASTGLSIFDGLPKNPDEFLYALHFQVPVIADFTNIAVVADEVRLVDASWTVINQFQAFKAGPLRTPQTAKLFQTLDFTSRGFDGDALRLNMASLVLELTFANAAPNAVNIIAEIGTTAPTNK